MRGLALLPCLVALALPASAGAAAYAPPPGKVLHSGVGGYDAGAVDAFSQQAGKRPAVFQYFVSWRSAPRDLRWVEGLLDKTAAAGARTLLSVSTKDTGLTPAALARGAGDRFVIAVAQMAAARAEPLYLRPLSEMNNANNPYSAYTRSGRSRGRSHSTAAFKRAWKRTALIVRGGAVAGINERLRRLRMAPVRTAATELPKAPIALMWVPLTFGNPEIAKNHPRHWWPGRRWVDWVGTTWYSPHMTVSAIERFYVNPLWRGKPFAFAEYGVWGAESPRFVKAFFRFVRTHRRVGLISYYQSALLKPEFRLSTHPRSRSLLRRLLGSAKFLAGG